MIKFSFIRSLLFSFFSGILFFLSWPPIKVCTFLIFIALVPLFILEKDIKDKKMSHKGYFAYVYLTFFIFNLFTTYWINYAHLGGAIFAILCNSFFMASVFYFYAKIKNSVNNGVFLSLDDNIEGFLHNNDISWTRKIKSISENCSCP